MKIKDIIKEMTEDIVKKFKMTTFNVRCENCKKPIEHIICQIPKDKDEIIFHCICNNCPTNFSITHELDENGDKE